MKRQRERERDMNITVRSREGKCLDVGRVNRTSDGFHSREERRTPYASANERTNEDERVGGERVRSDGGCFCNERVYVQMIKHTLVKDNEDMRVVEVYVCGCWGSGLCFFLLLHLRRKKEFDAGHHFIQ